jgi:poly(ADP-ribose) glycohydrolase ARH3
MPDSVGRARGALLGVLVGDALGMPYEGTARNDLPSEIPLRGGRLPAGSYTDDTEMTIVLAESLLRCDVVDEADLGPAFVAAHDPRRGYSTSTLRVLALIAEGLPGPAAARRIFEERGSLGNGAAMRVAPVAVRFYDDSVLCDAQARRSAAVTHAHPAGIDAAAVQAAAVAAAIDGADPLAAAERAATTGEMREALAAVACACAISLTPESLAQEAAGVPPTGPPSVAAAVVAGAWASDFRDAVTLAVQAGGDTDTVAAMAGAIAGARFGAAAIPREWLDVVENGERGRDHLDRLARELVARAESPVARAAFRSSA